MNDYVIIGAGFSGLAAAKTILTCEPDATIRILDRNKTVGGNWAVENIYPELQTNNLRGAIDFSDFPMHDGFGVAKEKHVPGTVVNKYVLSYVDQHNLMKYISFETTVLAIKRIAGTGGWRVEVSSPKSAGPSFVDGKRLIVATGANNAPHRPAFKGLEDFQGVVMHTAELGTKKHLITQNPSVQKVGVLGGGKSAYDAAYMAARNGKQVEWVIRKTGKGPVWVFPVFTDLGPFKHVWKERLVNMRLIQFFSYWLWNDGFSWVRWFLHRTWVGKSITKLFWNDLRNSTYRDCRFAEDPRYAALVPDANPSWYATTGGAFGYEPDLFEFIKNGQVTVRREDLSHFSKDGLHLADGTFLPLDMFIMGTGFSAKPVLNFEPASAHSDLGVPTSSMSEKQHEFWKDLDHKADLRIAAEYPALIQGPFPATSDKSALIQPYQTSLPDGLHYSPWRLYRSIAPPGLTAEDDRSLVFIGMFSNLTNTIRLEMQCLWMMAYFQRRLAIDHTKVFEETSLMSRYARWRSPMGHGRFFPDLVWDQMPYCDLLLQDLGLKFWRKPNLWKEITEPYDQADYKGIVEEWIAKEKNADKIRAANW